MLVIICCLVVGVVMGAALGDLIGSLYGAGLGLAGGFHLKLLRVRSDPSRSKKVRDIRDKAAA